MFSMDKRDMCKCHIVRSMNTAFKLSECSTLAKLKPFGLLTQIINMLLATSLQVHYCSNLCVTTFTTNNCKNGKRCCTKRKQRSNSDMQTSGKTKISISE